MTPSLASAAARSNSGVVRTVRGDIASADVGFTHCHEHTFILPGPSCQVNGDLLLDDLEKTTAELTEFYVAGGRTVVDAQPIGQERAPTLQRLAAERSGVHIVAATGFHRAIYYPPDHFRFTESSDALAERLIREVSVGMAEYEGSKVVRTTEIRAGLLKFASDYHVIDAQAQKAAEAVAAAHAATGAPILTHTEHGTCALEQIDLFERLGVHPSALLISHLDRKPDIFLHDEVTQSGAYVVYDGISRATRFPEAVRKRGLAPGCCVSSLDLAQDAGCLSPFPDSLTDSAIVGLICRLVELGRASHILVGMDMARRSMWRSYGGGPGMTYLGNVFLRRLRQAGMGVEQIRRFTEHNPAAALSFRNQVTLRAARFVPS